MSYNTQLQSNNAELQEILEAVQELPEPGEGGATPPQTEALDPDVVYQTTRPADWLPMPTPGDDEIYLLGHIPPNLDGAFTAQITYSDSCTVEFGSLVGGVFTAKESVVPTSGTRFYHTLYPDDYGDETSDGNRQYLVRLKGGFTNVVLYPGESDVYQYGEPMIVDAAVGTSQIVAFANSSEYYKNCRHLRYVRYVGNGTLNGGLVLRALLSLLAVCAQRKTTQGSMNYMFSNCFRLQAVSENLMPDNATYQYAFQGTDVPVPRVRFKPSNANHMFRETFIPTIDAQYIDTSGLAANMQFFLYNAKTARLLNWDISSLTNTTSIVQRTPLSELTFAGETTPGGWTIDLTYAIMGHKALVNMIISLPVATAAATLTITGNPGASLLTEDEIAVATAKNWTITI